MNNLTTSQIIQTKADELRKDLDRLERHRQQVLDDADDGRFDWEEGDDFDRAWKQQAAKLESMEEAFYKLQQAAWDAMTEEEREDALADRSIDLEREAERRYCYGSN